MATIIEVDMLGRSGGMDVEADVTLCGNLSKGCVLAVTH